MKRAGFVVEEVLFAAFFNACKHYGIELVKLWPQKFEEVCDKWDHIITWGLLKNSYQFHKDTGANILYLEQGRIGQITGITMDGHGLFADSSVSTRREFDQEPTDEEVAKLMRHVNRRFEIQWQTPCDPDGPIMLALQHKTDAPCTFYYPGCDEEDTIEFTLRVCAEVLPDRKVLVRPHPKFMEEWQQGWKRYKRYFRSNWTVDTSPVVYTAIQQCSALVTVNSTLASEAQLYDVPVATLGKHEFTGSGVTLDCSEDFGRLRDLYDFKASEEAKKRYLCALMRHHLYFPVKSRALKEHPSFLEWIERF